MRIEIVAEASAALLCRLIGLLAQRDFAAPDMQVRVEAGSMRVTLDLRGIPDAPCMHLAEKMRRSIGIEIVAIDGLPMI